MFFVLSASVAMGLPVMASHSLMESIWPVASSLPSGEIAVVNVNAESTRVNSLPFIASMSLTPCVVPTATILPSGETDAENICVPT
jgi:hypothetical protein